MINMCQILVIFGTYCKFVNENKGNSVVKLSDLFMMLYDFEIFIVILIFRLELTYFKELMLFIIYQMISLIENMY